MTLSQQQKEMIADMLQRTETSKDIEMNCEKILGSFHGDKKTVKAFRELAILRVTMMKSRNKK